MHNINLIKGIKLKDFVKNKILFFYINYYSQRNFEITFLEMNKMKMTSWESISYIFLLYLANSKKDIGS